MKRLVLSLALLFTIASSAFANYDVADPVLNSFHSSFYKAENVKWTESKNFFIASFSLEGKDLFAYYTKEGTLLVLAEEISFDKLPVKLQQQMKGQIINVYRMENDEEIAYFVVLENEGKRSIMKAFGKKWVVLKGEL